MSDSTSATSGQEPGAPPQAGTIHPESTTQAQAAAGTTDQPTTTVDVAVLQRELAVLDDLRAIVALGAFAWDGALRALAAMGHRVRPKPAFGHGAEASVGPYQLLGAFHPSQQNTFTGKLTPEMLDAIVRRAVARAV